MLHSRLEELIESWAETGTPQPTEFSAPGTPAAQCIKKARDSIRDEMNLGLGRISNAVDIIDILSYLETPPVTAHSYLTSNRSRQRDRSPLSAPLRYRSCLTCSRPARLSRSPTADTSECLGSHTGLAARCRSITGPIPIHRTVYSHLKVGLFTLATSRGDTTCTTDSKSMALSSPSNSVLR